MKMSQEEKERTENLVNGDRCDLGVLFVHGIGDQKEGETLTSFGEPLIEWMRGWISGRGELTSAEKAAAHGVTPDGVHVRGASLFPSRRHSPDPAHAVIEVRFTPQEDPPRQRRQRWLFAESWWGEQVQPPGVFSLLGWLFGRGVWVLLAHMAEMAWQFAHPRYTGSGAWGEKLLRLLDATRWRNGAWLCAGAVFVPAAALLQLLLAIAWVVALIPIPVMRRYIAVVLQHATLILGDSYGLVANETQRGAILTRFQNAVNWLQARCERLAIVAHSQGTGVVHAAMEGSFIDPPPLLITFGSGLAKLAQLRRCEIHYPGSLTAAGWIVPTAVLTILLTLWLKLGDTEEDWLSVLAFALGAATFFCAAIASVAWHNTRSAPQLRQGALANPGVRWIDLYASSDPVPQGDLAEYLPNGRVSSECIVNRRSLLSDHGTYWRNRTEFVTRVAAELDGEAKLLGIPDLPSDPLYQHAVLHHRRAIWALSAAWWAMCVPLLAAAVLNFSSFADAGKAFVAKLENAKAPLDSLAGYLKAPAQVIEWVAGSVPRVVSEFGYWLIVVVGGSLLAYLWWKVVAAFMSKWDGAQLADFLSHHKVKLWGPYGTWMAWPFVILLTFAPPFCVWLAIETGENVFLLPLKAMATILIAMFAFFQLLAILGGVLTAITRATTLARHAWTAVDLAATPGNDQSGQQSPWQRWKAMAYTVSSTLVAALAVGWVLQKITGNPAIGSFVTALPFVVAALLLTVRLVRLFGQRGYDAWFGTAVATAPVILLALYLTGAEFPLETQLFAVSGIAIVFAGLAYAAVNRWLPPRQAGDMIES